MIKDKRPLYRCFQCANFDTPHSHHDFCMHFWPTKTDSHAVSHFMELCLEVPKSLRNSGYLQEKKLDHRCYHHQEFRPPEEFQQLAKPKEIINGDPVMHAVWALYSPLGRSAACTPCIIPFSPFVCNTICVLRNGDPVVFINIYPPVQ